MTVAAEQQKEEGEQHQRWRTTASASLNTAWIARQARYNAASGAMDLKELRDLVSLDLPYMPRELIDGTVLANRPVQRTAIAATRSWWYWRGNDDGPNATTADRARRSSFYC